jgi:hypothetical protein
MKFSVVLALVLAGLTMTASAQKPKTKPAHSEEKESSKKGSHSAVKVPANHSSAAQELRRVEGSGGKASSVKKSESGKAARKNPALKPEKKEKNPPIHFASAGSSSKSGKNKAGDPYKGRMRHKGSH